MAIRKNEEAVAYDLVVELLAHQFAFPVQWIDTQATVMARMRRLVELGPSTTLLGMAQKSLDLSAGQSVELLASTQHQPQLCYVYDDPNDASTTDEPPVDTPESSITPDVSVVEGEQSPSLLPDVPLTALVVMRAILARKLRRSATEIDPTRSIKDLCGGKSTLQNELIGELDHELPALPDRAEDVPLADLDSALGSVSLGRTSSSLIQKLFSGKMPARTTVATVRDRLRTIWGLPDNRQTVVLLDAVAAEPSARLPSLEAAHQYWDALVEQYGRSVGHALRRQPTQGASQLVTRDSTPTEGQVHSLAWKQYEALRQYLGIPTAAPSTPGIATELQQKLDTWTAEFSDDFLDRVQSCFDARKTRWYRDWWNAGRQEVLALCEGLPETAMLALSDRDVRDRLSRRADDSQILIADAHPATQDLKAILSHGRGTLSRVKLATQPTMAPRTAVTTAGVIEYQEVPREHTRFADSFAHWLHTDQPAGALHAGGTDMTTSFLQSLREAGEQGVSFAHLTVLVTGAGPNSIAGDIVRFLLAGGATVIVTTSRDTAIAAPGFQQMYTEHASRDSRLLLVPFNQASAVDCERLMEHIYNLGLDLDAVIPFAAASQVGAQIDSIGGTHEAALRLMLVNVLRLIGGIASQKRRRGIRCRPTQVVLPFSPNHGVLGGDGLYGESKRGLETLMRRVHAESWADELSLCAVNMGWTRSTGLMNGNDIVAETAEMNGVRTFSGHEMASLITLMLTDDWAVRCERAPVLADLSGALGSWGDASTVLAAARASIQQQADIARAVALEDQREATLPLHSSPAAIQPSISLRVGFPQLPDYRTEIQPLRPRLSSDLVPRDAVVVVGFAELGPWGSARVRWEMEAQGQLSPAAYVEMAWLMNLIRHLDGPGPDGRPYVGWIDVQSGQPLCDGDIEPRYGETIRSQAGIRALPPNDSEFFQEIVLEDELPPFDTTRAHADALQARHGDGVAILTAESDDPVSPCRVQLRQGATIRVPRSGSTTPGVAGLLPTGWSPEKYGIPAELVQQLEPVTLVLLCCVAEAFYSAGISDPLEIFEHIHLSELGNFIGSSMGGVVHTRALYHDAFLDRDVPSDALQETYLNTAPAWVNMLLLGGAGPIKTPVGACATALESVDGALESIRAGHTKICLVGGYDDLQPEEAAGFAHMKATASVDEEQARGRGPSEMSRPLAASRAGFVESQGCGIQLLCRGDIALAMGLPVYGIIAGAGIAADGISRSVPAPGQGILTFARETHNSSPSPLRAALTCWGLDIDDLTVASLHGTSTPANDRNEPAVIQRQMQHLRRTPGRPLWAIAQKSITGHPKAPAAAWMLNGCLQMLDSGLVPGNRNLDDVDPELRVCDLLCFPTRSVQTTGVRSFLLNSCGFGQKEGQLVGVHPRYFFALQSPAEFESYQRRRHQRTQRADRDYVRALMDHRIVQVLSHPPYDAGDMESLLLNPLARLRWDPVAQFYQIFTADTCPNPDTSETSRISTEGLFREHPATVGVDMVTLSTFTGHASSPFIARNYTDREQELIQQHRDMKKAVASGWCSKEAVFKCLRTVSKGAAAAMNEIEILRSDGAPTVVLHGDALVSAQRAGLHNIQLSLSYSDDSVIAVALGVRS